MGERKLKANAPTKKKKASLKKPLRFTLIGGHMAHLIGLLSNMDYYKNQKRIYYKLLTTVKADTYKSLMEQKKSLPEEASSMNWELHKSETGYSIRVVYNDQAVDFCNLGNKEANFLCPLDTFRVSVAKLSNYKFKKMCGMHLKYKMPELKNAGNSTFVPKLILGILLILTVVFAIIGWGIRKRYRELNDMVNRELSSMEKRNE